MKLINKSKLTVLMRNYLLSFVMIYIATVSFLLFGETTITAYIINKTPTLFNQPSFDVSLFALFNLFCITFICLSFKIYKILKNEYFNVFDGFVEGPNQFGERIVIAKNQIKNIGLDYFGQFSIFTDDQKLVLPGKIDFSIERDLKRKLNNYLKN